MLRLVLLFVFFIFPTHNYASSLSIEEVQNNISSQSPSANIGDYCNDPDIYLNDDHDEKTREEIIREMDNSFFMALNQFEECNVERSNNFGQNEGIDSGQGSLSGYGSGQSNGSGSGSGQSNGSSSGSGQSNGSGSGSGQSNGSGSSSGQSNGSGSSSGQSNGSGSGSGQSNGSGSGSGQSSGPSSGSGGGSPSGYGSGQSNGSGSGSGQSSGSGSGSGQSNGSSSGSGQSSGSGSGSGQSNGSPSVCGKGGCCTANNGYCEERGIDGTIVDVGGEKLWDLNEKDEGVLKKQLLESCEVFEGNEKTECIKEMETLY